MAEAHNDPMKPLEGEEPITRREFLQVGAAAALSIAADQHGQIEQHLPPEDGSGTTHDMHDQHDLTEMKEALWKAEQAAYDKTLQLAEKPQEEVYSNAEIAEAFSTQAEVYVGCMDERVQIPAMKKIGVGGSCVLMSEEQIDRFIQNLAKKGIKVKFVSSHDGCGACNLYCKEHSLSADEAPRLAHETAEKMTKKLGKEDGASAHIPFREMEGNEHVHHARAITVDCNGFFRPKKLGFPATFELTAAAYPDMAQLQAELSVAVAIAEGSHGMGVEKFDATKSGQPVLLTLVEDPSYPELTAQVASIVEKVASQHPNTIKVIHLKAPIK